jgi:hypothetical protein
MTIYQSKIMSECMILQVSKFKSGDRVIVAVPTGLIDPSPEISAYLSLCPDSNVIEAVTVIIDTARSSLTCRARQVAPKRRNPQRRRGSRCPASCRALLRAGKHSLFSSALDGWVGLFPDFIISLPRRSCQSMLRRPLPLNHGVSSPPRPSPAPPRPPAAATAGRRPFRSVAGISSDVVPKERFRRMSLTDDAPARDTAAAAAAAAATAVVAAVAAARRVPSCRRWQCVYSRCPPPHSPPPPTRPHTRTRARFARRPAPRAVRTEPT